MYIVKESDWRLYRKRLADWQRAYMEALCKEYVAILSSNAFPQDRFWQLERRINRDKRSLGVAAEIRRSAMIDTIRDLLFTKVITEADLEGFSEELRALILYPFVSLRDRSLASPRTLASETAEETPASS